MNYDAWKTATPPEYSEVDPLTCPDCGRDNDECVCRCECECETSAIHRKKEGR